MFFPVNINEAHANELCTKMQGMNCMNYAYMHKCNSIEIYVFKERISIIKISLPEIKRKIEQPEEELSKRKISHRLNLAKKLGLEVKASSLGLRTSNCENKKLNFETTNYNVVFITCK